MVRDAGQGSVHEPFRAGANYGGNTIVWKIMARTDRDRKNIIAFGMDRGYAFASDHPEWPPGLLLGCRWGMLYPNEPESVRGRLYFLEDGNFPDLQERYRRDLK